jgi:hypothetical protein
MATDRPSDGGQSYGGPARVERPAPNRRSGAPDSLFIGVLVLLLAMPAAVWAATKLGGWFQHGRWPAISFGDAITAIKGLFFHPSDIALAWPAGERAHLPSTWVFWTVLVVMVLVVGALALDAVVVVRRRVVRRRAAREALDAFLAQRGN